MKFFYYRNIPDIQVRISVYRDDAGDVEDFADAKVTAWVSSSHGLIPAETRMQDGTIIIDVPSNLCMGVYGIKAVWTKEHGREEKTVVPHGIYTDNVFSVVSCQTGTTNDGLIQFGMIANRNVRYEPPKNKCPCNLHTKEEKVQVVVHDGKSAYQYAVEHGYNGTEEEFGASLANVQDENKRRNKWFILKN